MYTFTIVLEAAYTFTIVLDGPEAVKCDECDKEADMTYQQKIAWRDRFFRRAGRNALSFKSLFDALPNVLFHIVTTTSGW